MAVLLGLLLLSCLLSVLTGCSTAGQLNVSAVTYQSINTKSPQPYKDTSIPSSAKILASYVIDKRGQIGVIVTNLTDEILTIDQERSFLVNSDGISQAYYDPNVYTTTTTNYSFNTSGTSVNIGAIASALGVGGKLGSLLGGVSVSNSSTQGIANSNSITVTDQKKVNIGPHGTVALSKTFPIKGVGINSMSSTSMTELSYKDSPVKFSSCISYSYNDAQDYEKLVTEFYVSSSLYAPVKQKGKINAALRVLISVKADLLSQPWYMLYFKNNMNADSLSSDYFWMDENYLESVKYDNIVQGIIYNYQ